MSASDASPDSPGTVGQIFAGRYWLVDVLGRGGMGTVYVARRTDSVGEDVAIKVLHHKAADARFELEARVIQSLKSPFSVKLIEFGRVNGTPYIVMERLEGRTLDKALRADRLSPLRTAEVLRDIARALEEAHGLGVVHRDLKPANIFLQRVASREHVKVLDFGLAKVVRPEGLADRGPSPNTVDGSILGTAAFMSPEQCRGESVGPASDLYSLGVVGYLALAGKHPFHDRPAFRVLVAHINETPPRLQVGHGRLERRLAALIEALLQKGPEERPASARGVAEILDQMVADHLSRLRSPSGTPAATDRDQPSDLPTSVASVVPPDPPGWSLIPFIVPLVIALSITGGYLGWSRWTTPIEATAVAKGLAPSEPDEDGAEPSAVDAATDSSALVEASDRTEPVQAAPRRTPRRTARSPKTVCRIDRAQGGFGGTTDEEAQAVVHPLRAHLERCATRQRQEADRVELRLLYENREVRVRSKSWRAGKRRSTDGARLTACVRRAPFDEVDWPPRQLSYVVVELECRTLASGRGE